MFDALPHAAPTGELMPPTGAAAPDMDEVLRDFVAQHPNLAWLAQMIAARRAQTAAVDDHPRDDRQDEVDALNAALDQALARGDRLQRIVHRLAHELRASQERLADLAAAFGACGLCWGEDAHCPGCRGRGQPGHFAGVSALPALSRTRPMSDASRSSTPPEPMKGDEP